MKEVEEEELRNIIDKIFIILLIIAVISGTCMLLLHEAGTSEWSLTKGSNEVVFSRATLSDLHDTSPEVVFASITNKVTWVFEDMTGKTWNPSERDNTLTQIFPNLVYHVTVSENCVLTIH